MKNLKNKNPYLASVELTNICSSVCPGCLAKEGLEKEQLHIDQWTKILKNINPEIKHINISGGEPTEYKDLIKFCNILEKRKIFYSLMTNGDWKDSKKIVSDFKKLKYFTGFCFSIHGATKWSHKIFTGNDNYEKLIKNIKLAVKEKFTVITNTVLGENNKSEIKDLILLLKDLKVSSMFFSRYIGCLRQGISFYRDDMKKITDYFAEIEKIMPVIHLSNCFPQCFTKTDSNCKAGIDHYHIDCKGNLKFCAFSESIFGNLLNKKASEILKSSKAKSWINHIPKACKSCDIISACKGGCKTLIEILGITKDPLMTKPVEIVKKINKR